MKIRLSRRVVPSAKVNLNTYWNKFEELANQNLPIISLEIPNTDDIIVVNPLKLPQLIPVEENVFIKEPGNQ